MIFTGLRFVDKVVRILAGDVYRDCIFENCDVIYEGGHCYVVNCTFIGGKSNGWRSRMPKPYRR